MFSQARLAVAPCQNKGTLPSSEKRRVYPPGNQLTRNNAHMRSVVDNDNATHWASTPGLASSGSAPCQEFDAYAYETNELITPEERKNIRVSIAVTANRYTSHSRSRSGCRLPPGTSQQSLPKERPAQDRRRASRCSRWCGRCTTCAWNTARRARLQP